MRNGWKGSLSEVRVWVPLLVFCSLVLDEKQLI